MNAVANIESRRDEPTGGIAKTLERVQRTLLAPIETVKFSPGQIAELAHLRDRMGRAPANGDGISTSAWLAAVDALNDLPDRRELDHAIAACEAALGDSDGNQTRGLVAMMLAVYRTEQLAKPAAYADAIVHDILALGYSPTVVALACQQLRRTSKFLPAVSEVLEACERAKKDLAVNLSLANRMLDLRDTAERIAALPQSEPTPWELKLYGRRAEPHHGGDDEIPF